MGRNARKVLAGLNNPKRENLERLDQKAISWEVFPTMNRVSWPQKHSKNWISLAVFLTHSSIYFGLWITSPSSHNVKVVGYLILYEIRRDLVYFPEKRDRTTDNYYTIQCWPKSFHKFLITIVSENPKFLNCIPDSKAKDFGFHNQFFFCGFRILQAKIPRIPESGFPNILETTLVSDQL